MFSALTNFFTGSKNTPPEGGTANSYFSNSEYMTQLSTAKRPPLTGTFVVMTDADKTAVNYLKALIVVEVSRIIDKQYGHNATLKRYLDDKVPNLRTYAQVVGSLKALSGEVGRSRTYESLTELVKVVNFGQEVTANDIFTRKAKSITMTLLNFKPETKGGVFEKITSEQDLDLFSSFLKSEAALMKAKKEQTSLDRQAGNPRSDIHCAVKEKTVEHGYAYRGLSSNTTAVRSETDNPNLVLFRPKKPSTSSPSNAENTSKGRARNSVTVVIAETEPKTPSSMSTGTNATSASNANKPNRPRQPKIN